MFQIFLKLLKKISFGQFFVLNIGPAIRVFCRETKTLVYAQRNIVSFPASNQKVAGAECTSPPLTANRSKFLPLSSRRTVANEVCDSSSGWDDSYYSAALDEVMADLEPRSSAPPPAEIPAAPTAVATTGSTVSQHPSSFLCM